MQDEESPERLARKHYSLAMMVTLGPLLLMAWGFATLYNGWANEDIYAEVFGAVITLIAYDLTVFVLQIGERYRRAIN